MKVAVTGLGVSRNYLPNYVHAPESELALVHDIDADKAQRVAEEHGVARWTIDFKEVLDSDVDILDVSTPNQYHAEQAIAAMEAGKHVLCQKPIARNISECRTMVEAAKRTGKVLGMMMTWRNNPYAGDIRRAIQEGYLGKIAAARVRNAHTGPLHIKGGNHWRFKADNIGGGTFMQLGVHPMNLALWMLDQDMVSIMAYADNLYCQHSLQGEDVAAAVAQLENGALFTMEAGYSSQGKSIEIYGTEGNIIMTAEALWVAMARDFEGERLQYRKSAAEDPVRPGLAGGYVEYLVPIRGNHNDPERNQNRAFVQALLAGEPPPSSGEEGMRDVAIVQALYRSAAEGRRVEIAELLQEESDGQGT